MGDWDGAWDDANRATQIAATSGQEAGRAFGLAAQALVSAHRGREAETRAIVTEGLEVAVRTGAVPAALLLTSMLGFLELSLGRLAAAHRHLGPLVESAAAEGITEPGGARYLGDGLEVLVRLGELELAERVTTDLTQRSAELDRAWGLMVGARTRGLACSAVADLPGARAALDEALAQNERLSQPFELGRTLLARGGVERRDRQKRSARALLEQALEVFSNLGADLWIQRARSELERISGRAPIGVELSETEERIAQLTAEGATNQEVGASLFLTAKTVEWYLSRIYRKLGIRSRTELARWMGTHASPGSASGRLS
jgi:DNA-binding CsgD family transcriptional regulator